MKKIESKVSGKRRRVKYLAAGGVILFFLCMLAGMGWYGVTAAFKYTGKAEFCGSCHSMKPMILAYGNDIHGGKNRTGVMADCATCHLPHDSLLNYALQKQITGMHDLWTQLTSDTDKIDWKAKRKERESYVYDSGCLTCHGNLERATSSNIKAFVAHKPYFMGTIRKKCVSCHQFAGHDDLNEFLSLSLNEKGDVK